MQQTLIFMTNLFCAGAFLLILAVGFLLCFLRKPLGSAQTMQKLCGLILIMMALHIIYVCYVPSANNTNVMRYAGIALVFADYMIAIIFAGKSIMKLITSLKDSQIPVQVVEAVEKEVAEEKNPDEEVVEEAAAEEKGANEDESVDEAADVNPLDKINIEDLIFFQKVEALMAQKRLFSNPEISRESIAAEIGTNRTYLVRSIKNATGKTFLEYITDLRTSYAATLLTTTDNALDSIGSLVGFRSKSAYYRAFAAAYNCPPSEYRKKSRKHRRKKN